MELQEVTYEVLATGDKMPSGYYLKTDVDAVIAEKDKYIAELNEFAEDACLERDDNQTAIDELQAENAELKKKLDEKESWVKMLSDAEVYLKDKADEAIAELKDKCQMHDFFWEGCGFARRGFKNTIAVSEAFDRLEAENKQLKADVNNVLMQNQELCRALQAMYSVEEYMKLQNENAELKQKLEDVNELIKTARKMLEDAKATHYVEMVDAGMRERRLCRALYKALTNWAFSMDDLLTNKILDGNHSDKLRFTRDRWWRMGHKCLKKAEEYK